MNMTKFFDGLDEYRSQAKVLRDSNAPVSGGHADAFGVGHLAALGPAVRQQAERSNANKRRVTLVSSDALRGLVEVLEFGARKYTRDNWKKGLPYTDVLDSLFRHLFAFIDGEDNDPESGLHHINHVLCNAMFLSHYVQNAKYADFDNRGDES